MTAIYRCMIQGYLRHGDSMKANKLITEMKNKGIPDKPRKGNGRTEYV
jgi:pentatricopeptide repeat protein